MMAAGGIGLMRHDQTIRAAGTAALPTPAITSVQQAVLRVNGVRNVSQALYVNALNLDRLLALGSS